MPLTALNDRISRLLVNLERCESDNDRALLRETLKLLRDDLRSRDEEFRRADARYRLAITAAGIGVFDWNLKTSQVTWNDHHARLFGLDPAYFAGNYEAFDRCVHPDDRAALNDRVQHSVQTRTPYEHTFRIVHPDGQVRWIQGKGQFLFDEAGEAIRMVGTCVDVTDRVENERLAESDRILRAIMEHVPEGITVADAPDVTIRMVSRYGQELTGRPKNAIEGISADLHAQQWGLYRADGKTPASNDELPLTRATRHGEVIEGEQFILRQPGGHDVPILCNAGPVRDAAGNITGGVIAWRDITQQKQNAVALAEVAERYARQSRLFEQIASTTPDFIYIFDLDGRFIYANRRLLEVWGRSAEQAIGKNLYELGYPQWHADMHMDEIRQVIETRRPIKGEVPFTGASGAEAIYEYIFTPVIGPDGQVEVIAGTTRDVTDRRKTEESLRESENRFRSTFEHAAVGIAHIGPDYRWLRVNKRYCDILGYTPEELRQLTFADITHPDDLESDWDLVNQAVRGEIDRYSMEKRYIRKDRSVVWVNLTVALIRDDNGAVSYFIAAAEDISERKHGEQALRESQDRLRSVLETSLDAAYRRDLRSETYDYLSPVVEQVMGISAERLRSLNLQELTQRVHPEDRPALLNAVEEGYRHGRGKVIYRLRGDDGQYRWLADHFSMQTDADGRPQFRSGIVRDITEQKHVEASLRQSEAHARQIIDNTLCFVGVLLPDGTLKEANAPALTAAGIRREDVIGKRFWDCYWWSFDPTTQSQLQDAVARAARGEIVRYDVVVRMAGDARVPIEFMLAPVRDSSGRITHLIPSGIDITERKRAQAVVQRSSERWALLAQTAADLLVSREPQRVVDELCRKVMEHLKCDVFFNYLLDESNQKLTLNACYGVDESDGPISKELELGQAVCGCVARDGKRVIAERISHSGDERVAMVRSFGIQAYACHPLTEADGRVIGTLSFGTRRRERFTDDELALMKAVTDQVAVAMVRQRAEVQLRTAKQAAELANNAKDHFLAVLSHELRTPLTPVLVTAQMLERDATLSGEHRGMVQMIRRNVELEARLIDDLLDLTRIARGKLELQTSQIDVHEKISHVLRMCEEEINAKRLDVSLQLQAANCHVQADPTRFQQVIWNLLKNATKFTPIGGSISVSTRDEAGRVVVEVIDDGVGIPPDKLPHIFDAFEQGGRDITRQFGGLGLGLAISKALVEMHGGTIAAASAGRDRGATFAIALPAVDASAGERSTGDAHAGGSMRCRILLAEDHADTRQMMTLLLSSFGCDVKPAATAAEALKLAGEHPFDLLISDIGLPDQSGTELMRQIKARHNLKGIALSGYGMEEDVAKSKAAGFEAHLTKPVNLQALEETVRRLTRLAH